MASRIMHDAAATITAKIYPIQNPERFFLGILLPDAYAENKGTAESHLKCTIDNGTKKTYDLEAFRTLFADELKNDDLYRGYYLHLVQDLHFREFVYQKYRWNPKIPGNVARLHRDYRLLNRYVIAQNRLSDKLTVPEHIENERIFQLYLFDLEQLKSDLHEDFTSEEVGEYFFFTPQMADEFIELAAEASVRELRALDAGGWHADMRRMAWMSQ